MERLQKIMAAAGIGSRRACEAIILEGRVEVDRQTVIELGTQVDPESQEIRVDGAVIKPQRLEYFAINKPPGVVSSNSDPGGRPLVVDLIDTRQRVFTVGRLDKSSEGLMIVTNDGQLAQQLTHPKFGCHKSYLITVAGNPENESLLNLKRGIRLSDGYARIHEFTIKKRFKTTTVIEIVLREGRNREIRRLLAAIGHRVLKLRRIAIGPIRLADLPLGAHRKLDHREVKLLQQFSKHDHKKGRSDKKDDDAQRRESSDRKPRGAGGKGRSSDRSFTGSNRKPDAASSRASTGRASTSRASGRASSSSSRNHGSPSRNSSRSTQNEGRSARGSAGSTRKASAPRPDGGGQRGTRKPPSRSGSATNRRSDARDVQTEDTRSRSRGKSFQRSQQEDQSNAGPAVRGTRTSGRNFPPARASSSRSARSSSDRSSTGRSSSGRPSSSSSPNRSSSRRSTSSHATGGRPTSAGGSVSRGRPSSGRPPFRHENAGESRSTGRRSGPPAANSRSAGPPAEGKKSKRPRSRLGSSTRNRKSN